MILAPHIALAQQASPLSAIDWLSQSVEAHATIAPPAKPKPDEPPIASSADVPQVTVTELDAPAPAPIGLLSSEVTGLPKSLWASSNSQDLVPLLQAAHIDALPAVQELLMTLLLAEAAPPLGERADGLLYLARVDKLLDIGALDPALALLVQGDNLQPDLFRRWFDVALLTGTEDEACSVMRDTPRVAPTYPARIFCTARNGDWSAAALILNTHRVLGDITPEEEALMSRFLDPDLFEDEPPLPAPTRLSPLVFRMREAIGEAMTTTRLPNAFAHADLRSTTGWKSQLEAAERLARIGAISENVLFGFYMARKPAASGGIWDRARAVQALDIALKSDDADAASAALKMAWDEMQTARLEVTFSRYFAPSLTGLALTGQAAEIALDVGLLSPNFEAVAQANDTQDFRVLLAQGVPEGAQSDQEKAIQTAFDGIEPSAEFEAMVLNGELGAALLHSIATADAGLSGNLTALTDVLAFWRSIGLEDVARKTALQALILERAS
ncbi:hypothetical protein [Yoonia sp. MH D7]